MTTKLIFPFDSEWKRPWCPSNEMRGLCWRDDDDICLPGLGDGEVNTFIGFDEEMNLGRT